MTAGAQTAIKTMINDVQVQAGVIGVAHHQVN